MICGSYSKEKSNSKGNTARDAFAHALRVSASALEMYLHMLKVVATQTTISPGKKVQLSQQYLQQLKTIQALRNNDTHQIKDKEGASDV